MNRLREAGLPFVGIGRTAHADDMCWVDVDYAALISRCVHHLADLGHRHIALVNRSAELVAAGYGPGLRACEGFAQAVAQRGVTGTEFVCGDDVAAGEACMASILATHPEITAIATVNEAALPGVQRALEAAGRSVPRDFSIAGVAARQWAEEFRPRLTATDIPVQEMGTRAVELLLEHIAAPAAPAQHILLTPPISLRSSTASAPGV